MRRCCTNKTKQVLSLISDMWCVSWFVVNIRYRSCQLFLSSPIPSLVWYPPSGCVFLHPLPSPTHGPALVPLWRPPSGHHDPGVQQQPPGQWLHDCGGVATPSPAPKCWEPPAGNSWCSSTTATTPSTTNWISSWKVHTNASTRLISCRCWEWLPSWQRWWIWV